MNKRKMFFVAIAGLALTACSFDDTLNKLEYDTESPAEVRISAQMKGMEITRGTNTTLQATELLLSSSPAVYICKTTKTAADNGYFYQNLAVSAIDASTASVPYKLTLGSTTLYFPQDKTGVDAYVYAPSQTAITDLNADITFTVNSSQVNDANYQASDFVWGKQTLAYSSSAANVNVTLSHLLSKIIFIIKDANNVQVEDIRSVTLGAVYDKVKVHMSTGAIASETSSTATITFLDTSNSANDGYSDGTAGTNVAVTGIIPPQDIYGKTLTINIGGNTYTGAIPEATASSGKAEVVGGNEYTYTITLTQSSFTVSAIAINPWTGNARTGTAQ